MAKLKYKINDFMDELPARIKIADIIEKLKPHRITYDTFNRDRKIKISDSTSIPEDRLQVYAGLFGCTMDELITTRKKVKPLIRANGLAKSLGIKIKKI